LEEADGRRDKTRDARGRRSWRSSFLGDPGPKFLREKLRKAGKKNKEQKRRKRDGIQTAELDRRDQLTATKSWPSSLRKEGTEVDYQVAAPAEMSTPNLHRAKIGHERARMEGWRQGRLGSNAKTANREEKEKLTEKEKPT